MISFGPIQLNELTYEDMINLKRSVDISGDQEEIREAFLTGHAIAWKFENGVSLGLLVIQETEEKELVIKHLAGKNLFKHRKFIMQTLEDYAKLRGLKAIRCSAVSKGTIRVYKNLGFEKLHEVLRKEI